MLHRLSYSLYLCYRTGTLGKNNSKPDRLLEKRGQIIITFAPEAQDDICTDAFVEILRYRIIIHSARKTLTRIKSALLSHFISNHYFFFLLQVVITNSTQWHLKERQCM